MKKPCLILGLAALLGATAALAEERLTVPMELLAVEGNQAIGEIVISTSAYGLVFTPQLHGLTPGIHGFHVHANPDCGPTESDGQVMLGGAAGGHFDPGSTGRHGLPWTDDNHLGDLPALSVDADGNATQPVLTPRLKSLDQVRDRSLMIHVGGDNHADEPLPLGGGSARMACGVIR